MGSYVTIEQDHAIIELDHIMGQDRIKIERDYVLRPNRTMSRSSRIALGPSGILLFEYIPAGMMQ